jgi:HEAT repeat protein
MMANPIITVKDLLDGIANQRTDISMSDVSDYLNSKTLSELEDELLPTVIDSKMDNYFRRISALEILLARGENKYSDLLVKLSSDPDPIVRCWVIEQALSHVDTKRSFKLFVDALQTDPEPTIRSVAAECLGKLGDLNAKPILRAVVSRDNELNDQGFSVSEMAEEALRKLK